MILKCKMCGGDLHPEENATTCVCEFCGTVQTIPKLDNDRRANLYDRANHFRRNNEYDKAMGIFEQILEEERTDAEAYWSILLCRYGIEYVEDPATGKRVPTVNRTQFASILADEDYKAALRYADTAQKAIYEEEAAAIDGIQKGILEISKKERPFDVFICYKETDAEGRRTPDSVLANDLYHQLVREGFKVFFSRITLEDKIGQQYEPYIFAALNTAKVMVVMGTRPEYFTSPWVKNEWSRYLALIRAGADKTLVPAYKDMDPYDLPEEFSHLQALDMGRLGFMQDLIHGIKKLTGESKPAPAPQPVVVRTVSGPDGSNVTALLDRAFMALEDGEWSRADDFCEKALNIDARNARAYVGKLMAELKVRREDDLKDQPQPIENSGNYAKALRFADEDLRRQLTEANDAIIDRNAQERFRRQYNESMNALNSARTVSDVRAVKARFVAMSGFKGAAEGINACDKKIESINAAAYSRANDLMKQQRYAEARAAFRALGDYSDSQAAAGKCDQLESQRQAELAAAKAEEAKREAARRAKEEAERREKERVAAELKAREEENLRREAELKAARIRKAAVVCLIVAVIGFAAAMLAIKVIIPGMQYRDAIELQEAYRYEEAIEAFTALGDYKDSVNRIKECRIAIKEKAYQAALALQQTGKYDEAIAAFTKLSDYSDSAVRVRQTQADKAFAAGQYGIVSDIYSDIPVEYQNHAEELAAMYDSATEEMETGNYDAAVATFTKLGCYSDSKAQILRATYLKADCLAAVGDYDAAVNLYNSLGGYSDSTILAAKAKADKLYDAGFYADAYDIYATLDEAYQSHINEYAAMYAAAMELQDAGQYDEAADAFDSMGNYSDSKTQVLQSRYLKAGALAAAGNYDDAVAIYNSLGDYSDSKSLIVKARADQLYDAGSYAEAYDHYAELEEAYQIHADDYAAMYAAAADLQASGKYDEAADAFTALGNYNDSKTQILQTGYRKAGSLAAAGSYDDAIALYDSLGDYSDSGALSAKAGADKLYDEENYAEAYAVYAVLDDAYQTHADDYAAMYAAAEAARAFGDFDGAYDQFMALGSYSDAAAKAAQCGVDKAKALFDAEKYREAAEVYVFIGDRGNADLSLYRYAGQLAEQGQYRSAADQYFTILDYEDSREQHYRMGLQARINDELADAYSILSEDAEYRDAKDAIYQTGVSASAEKLYEVSVPCYTLVGAYKDAAMRLTMDTYAWGGQLYENADYEKSAEVFDSMGEFSDAPARANEARYAAAGALMNDGRYDEAAARYQALGSFGDSAEKVKEAKYAAAAELLEAGEYGDAGARFTALGDYSDSADMVRECAYIPAAALHDAGQYQEALDSFNANGLAGYKDSGTLMDDCRYQLGMAAMAKGDYAAARDWFDTAGSYGDSTTQASECRYQIALGLMKTGRYDEAISAFSEISSYSDSKARITACYNAKAAALEAAGSFEAAYAQYAKASNTDKMKETAYQAALVKLSSGSYEEAISWYERAEDYRDAKEQILSIGEYYYTTQQYDLAEAVYVKVPGTGVADQRLYELGQYYELVGNYSHAAQCYREAGDHQDAPDKAAAMQQEVDYQEAGTLYLAGDYEGAKRLYSKITGYKDVDSKLAEARDAVFSVGNYVTFGTYPQTEAGTDSTAVEWLVLARDGEKVLLISRYALDCKPYNTSYTGVTWETCDLRYWLNNDFINKAFTSTEQQGILTVTVDNSKSQGNSNWSASGGNNTQDKVFLLSYAEAGKYFISYEARKCAPTDYAVKNGAYTSSSYKTDGRPTGWWWLRSPGSSSSLAAYVRVNGALGDYSRVYITNGVVRPALWIDLGSGIF